MKMRLSDWILASNNMKSDWNDYIFHCGEKTPTRKAKFDVHNLGDTYFSHLSEMACSLRLLVERMQFMIACWRAFSNFGLGGILTRETLDEFDFKMISEI